MSFIAPIGSVLMRSDENHTDPEPTTSTNEIVHLVLVAGLFMAGLALLVLAVL
jgi:hypothetical protein